MILAQRLLPCLLVAAVLATVGITACRRDGTPADTSARSNVELPGALQGWTARGPTAKYDATTIFDYIDGHAEVYLAYGLRRCLARRYAGPGDEPDIVVDLFELASPEDAFGVATYDREGTPVPVGRDALFRHGWLSFWRGPYFVSVLAERETARAQAAVVAIGRDLAARLPDEGSPPAVVSALPPDGLRPQATRFLRHPQILNTHVFVDDENLLGLDPSTSAALGRYERGGLDAHLLVVDYPDAARAAAAGANLARRFGVDVGGGPSRAGDRGWFAVRARDARLAVAIDAGSGDLASTLVEQALDRKGGGTP